MKESSLLKKEISVIQIALIVTLIVGISGLLVAYYTQSVSVFIDATYTLIGFFVYLLALYSIKKLHLSPNRKYQYGYYKFETMTVMVQAIMIFIVISIVLVMAVIRLFQESHDIYYGIAALYTAFSVVLCYTMYWFTNRRGRQLKSIIIKADAKLWKADCFLSAGVLLGLLATYISQLYGAIIIPRYADPIIALIIVAVLLPEPLRLMKTSLAELLDVSAHESQQKKVTSIVTQEISNYPQFNVSQIRTQRAGRMLFIDINYQLPPMIVREELNKINNAIRKKLRKQFHYVEINFCI